MSDGYIRSDESWYPQIRQLAEKVVDPSLDDWAFFSINKEQTREKLGLSAQAAEQILKKGWLRLTLLPAAARQSLERIADTPEWSGTFRGRDGEYDGDFIKQFAVYLTELFLASDSETIAVSTEIHESMHAADSARHREARLKISQLFSAIMKHFESNQHVKSETDLWEAKQRVDELNQMRLQLRVLEEAEAFLHELFVSKIVDARHITYESFSLPLWAFRLATVMGRAVPNKNWKQIGLEKRIARWQEQAVGGVSAAYELATLILLFEGDILSADKNRLVDFVQIKSPEVISPGAKLDANRIAGLVLDKSLASFDDPNQFANQLLAKDVRSKIITKLTQIRARFGQLLIDTVLQMPFLVPAEYSQERFDQVVEVVQTLEEEAKQP